MGAVAIMPTGTKSLMERVNEYVKSRGISKAEIAQAVGFSRPAVSQFCSGNYQSEELERKLETYLEEHADAGIALSSSQCPERPSGFFASHDAQAVLGVCQSCQQDIGLGIVVGRSGYGKTYALQHYAKLPKVAYIECDDTMGKRDLVESIERALGMPSSYGTIWRRVNAIRQWLNANQGQLIIIDEADKLISRYTYQKMEILRGIFDQADVGLVIAGEPALEAQIKSYLPRFANRVDCYAALGGLTETEIRQYLNGYEIHEDALRELAARAQNKQNGCFRLLDRTLKNVFRILKETGQTVITMEVISKASGMMML